MTGTQVFNNIAERAGGGLYVNNHALITDVQVIGNRARLWAGGLYQNLFTSQVRITGGRFENNLVTGTTSYGGGLFSSSAATIIGTEVISNVGGYGGGMHLSSGGLVSGVLVISNTATLDGGGLHQDSLLGQNLFSQIKFWNVMQRLRCILRLSRHVRLMRGCLAPAIVTFLIRKSCHIPFSVLMEFPSITSVSHRRNTHHGMPHHHP